MTDDGDWVQGGRIDSLGKVGNVEHNAVCEVVYNEGGMKLRDPSCMQRIFILVLTCSVTDEGSPMGRPPNDVLLREDTIRAYTW
jgi:hypothetical protein